MIIRHVAWLALLGAVLTGSRGLADDLTTSDGKVYKDYNVQKTDSDGITIKYTEMVTIPFDNLPDDMQKKFGHDPNVLSIEQAAEKARIEAENREAAKVEAGLDEQDIQIEPALARIKAKAKATTDSAAAPKVNIIGQILVTTPGGETIDFSGIHVGLVPMELINLWLPEKQARVATETRLLKPRIDHAQKDEDVALKERTATVGTGKFSEALDKEARAHDILDTLIERQDYFTGGEYYADALAPWLVTGATTDLTGKFIISAPSSGDFVLTASLKSESGTTIEKYYWFVKIHLAGNTGANVTILLDNENQSSSSSDDSVFKTEVSGTP